MIQTCRAQAATALLFAATVLLSGCEVDIEGGTFDAAATGSMRFIDGSSETYDRTIRIDAQLGQDAGGVAKDVLVFTFCDDTVDSPIWQPCFEPFELAVRQNHFGGEEYNYGSFLVDAGDGSSYTCDLEETLVVSGDLLDSEHFELAFSYTATIGSYNDPRCTDELTSPTYVNFQAEAARQGAESD